MNSAGLKRILILPVLVLAAAGLLHLISRDEQYDPAVEKAGRGPVVAIVEGQSIFLDDLKPAREMPDIHPGLADDEKPEASFRNKKARLISIVRNKILDRRIAELGLPPYDEELNRYAARMLEERGVTEESALKAISEMRAVAEALEEWLENPDMSDAIYDEKLAPISVSRKEWDRLRRYHGTPEKVEKMLSMLPEDFEAFIIQSRSMFEQEFLYKKVREFIGAGISVSKEEVEDDYNLIYGHLPENERPGLDEVESELHKELRTLKQEEAFREWRREQFLKADIQLIDKRFENILQFLF